MQIPSSPPATFDKTKLLPINSWPSFQKSILFVLKNIPAQTPSRILQGKLKLSSEENIPPLEESSYTNFLFKSSCLKSHEPLNLSLCYNKNRQTCHSVLISPHVIRSK